MPGTGEEPGVGGVITGPGRERYFEPNEDTSSPFCQEKGKQSTAKETDSYRPGRGKKGRWTLPKESALLTVLLNLEGRFFGLVG